MSKKGNGSVKQKGYRSVGKSIMLMNLVIVIIVSVVVSVIALFSLHSTFNESMKVYHAAKLEGYKQEIVSETQSAISMVQMEYDKYKSGEMTEEEAKKRAAEDIRNFRYRDDQSGYFWIDDLDYNLVMHPILTDQEGKNRKDLEDKKGNMIIQMIRNHVPLPKKVDSTSSTSPRLMERRLHQSLHIHSSLNLGAGCFQPVTILMI